ncbi:MAG: hypothetical protein QM715_06305 [Nibricoccus sp.]
MIERTIQAVFTESPGLEEPAATRERLKSRFPAGAARRMTQLGMLTGSVLGALDPSSADAVVYASEYGESRALEAFLESFPSASPTMFQTSIHPSGVQQGLIGRQRGVPELFPFAGAGGLAGHALVAALINPAARVLFCGGEERGTWLRERGVASGRTFAFALGLGRDDAAGSVGRVAVVEDSDSVGRLSLYEWFGLLESRNNYNGPMLPGLKLQLVWSKS